MHRNGRFLLAGLAIALALFSLPAVAQEMRSPVYQRTTGEAYRHGSHGWPAYGGVPYFAPPVVAGNWYVRPYPHHFDYYRWRYSAPRQAPVDCPCAEPARIVDGEHRSGYFE